MERKVGEVFEYNGVKLKVIKEIKICKDCYFNSIPKCGNFIQIRGECQSASRSDGGVIFVKVGYMEERTIKLSLEKAKEYYEAGGELRNIALQAFRKDEIVERVLPKTWEEYLAMQDDEEFRRITNVITYDMDFRAADYMKLRYLRLCYQQDWTPDWSDSHQTKYCIVENDGLEVSECYQNRQFLAFQTQELAEQFLDNFRDLIIKADIL